MQVINFKDASCARCYKCLRHCPTKAIRVIDGHAQIIKDLCVFCGHCTEVCPQNAKTFDSDVNYVKKMIARGDNVVVSLDPSYKGILRYYEDGQVVSALLKLGFSQVRETAEGASFVTQEYRKIIEEGKMENIISTACPVVSYMVEKHYPELVPYLAPVVSPMIAHGKMIKKYWGKDTKVVFIGPCLAKKAEAEIDPRNKGAIDAVIEFMELEEWLEEEGIDLHDCDEKPFANPDSMVNQLYGVNRGILRSIQAYGGLGDYLDISVYGRQNCKDLLHSMTKGFLKKTFIELNACDGVCVNGPGVNTKRGFRFKARMDIEMSAVLKAPEYLCTMDEAELRTEYEPRPANEKMPTEEEIQEALKTVGRRNSKQLFDCGACGYETCREKAIAICQGKAEAAMCQLRTYEVIRSKANVVMEATPSIILIYDKELRLREYNIRAEEYFGVERHKALQMYLFDFFDTKLFEEVIATNTRVMRNKLYWPQYNMVVLATVVPIENSDTYLAIIENVTAEEKKYDQMLNKKLETVRIAQEVIDKQMKTAQEIAGLLGETTAETKAILTKLRDSILEEEV